MAIIKKKICTNSQCESPVNEANATVCRGCNISLARVNAKVFLSEEKLKEEVEKIRNPKPILGDDGSYDSDGTGGADGTGEEQKEYVTCPHCGNHVIDRPGLERCPDCGENIFSKSEVPSVTALRSLDGKCCLQLQGDWLKIGREATGREYFESEGKRKVSREHAIMRRIEGAWYISYCKKEDRNYSGGIENPIFINGQRLGREENVRLQIGDIIGFAERDPSYPTAAFFRAE